MIIPALVKLYDRLVDDGDETVAPKGYSRQQISFKIVLNKNGSLHGIEPVFVDVPREIKRKTKGQTVTETKVAQRPAPVLVPGQSKPSGSGLNPCFLWDNAAYMLGFKFDDPKPERTREAFNAFRNKHLALLGEIKDEGFKAVCKFLESWEPSEASAHKELPEMTASFGVFQLRGESGYVHYRPAVRSWWDNQADEQGTDAAGADAGREKVPSLATGLAQSIARLHEPKIKGVMGAQSSGATIVSFNQGSFTSYGKDQGANAPVGADDAFKYCTALNRLTTDDKHRVRIAGDTFVFWSEAKGRAEQDLASWFAASLDDTVVTDQRLSEFMESARAGRPVKEFGEPSAPFYILGLSPNMARLSVRLWLVSNVGEIVRRLGDHHRVLHVEPVPDRGATLTIRRLVSETAPPANGFPDADRVIPTLAADVMRAILVGTPYPRSLLSGIVARARVEGLADSETRNDFRNAQHRRCAVIRACLTRNYQMEVPVSLDPDRLETAYVLGRLFAVLERIQENALGREINRTIKDSYYGSASTSPSSVFPRLLKLTRHHINKIDIPGQRINRERELGAVMDCLSVFPRLHGLEDQGLFAIGYYHQRQSYFTRAREDSPVSDETELAPAI